MSVFGVFGLGKKEEEVLRNLERMGKGEAEFITENGEVVGVKVTLEIRFPKNVSVSVSQQQLQQKQQQVPKQQSQPKQEQQAPQQPKAQPKQREKANYKEVYESLKKAGVYFKKENGVFIALGKTYANKENLKRAGFKWNPEMKAWTKPAKAQAV